MIQVDVAWGHNDYNGWHDGPNSVGGIDVGFALKNTSQNTIKYVILTFVPYNSVGDKVACEITGKVENSVKYTGPLEPNKIAWNQIFENAWYNHSITSVKIAKAEILYWDNTSETVNGSDIWGIQSVIGGGGGCYVATAVYGSYDCPEVWTLRRFRDYELAKTWYGRAFISFYYAVSPTIVELFGNTEWFKKMWRGKLDHIVENLKIKGYKDTPYDDRIW